MWKAGGGLDQSSAACTLQSAGESEEAQCQGPIETSEIRTSETRILENPSTHSQGWEERTSKPKSAPCKWDRSHWAIETVTTNLPLRFCPLNFCFPLVEQPRQGCLCLLHTPGPLVTAEASYLLGSTRAGMFLCFPLGFLHTCSSNPNWLALLSNPPLNPLPFPSE